MDELDGLEQEVLNERLAGAEHVPIHKPETARAESSELHPASNQTFPNHCSGRRPVALEDDEEAELKQLQASMAM